MGNIGSGELVRGTCLGNMGTGEHRDWGTCLGNIGDGNFCGIKVGNTGTGELVWGTSGLASIGTCEHLYGLGNKWTGVHRDWGT